MCAVAISLVVGAPLRVSAQRPAGCGVDTGGTCCWSDCHDWRNSECEGSDCKCTGATCTWAEYPGGGAIPDDDALCCDNGQVQLQGRECSWCSSGQQRAGNACVDCAAGETSDGAGGPCVACTPGKSDADRNPATPCADCVAGRFSDAIGVVAECARVCSVENLSSYSPPRIDGCHRVRGTTVWRVGRAVHPRLFLLLQGTRRLRDVHRVRCRGVRLHRSGGDEL